jgi:hypothetical protein
MWNTEIPRKHLPPCPLVRYGHYKITQYASSRHWRSRSHPICLSTPGCYVDKLHSKVSILLPSSLIKDLLHLASQHVRVFVKLYYEEGSRISWMCIRSSPMTREWGLSCLYIRPSASSVSNGFERTVAEPESRSSRILSKRLVMGNKRTRNKNILLIKIYNVCMSNIFRCNPY